MFTSSENMWNNEIGPPDVDMRYKSFFDKEKEEIGGPLYELESSLLINCELLGCQI